MKKKLHTLILTEAQTDLTLFNSFADEIQEMEARTESDPELAIELAGSGKYELLFVDKNLPVQDYNKIFVMADVYFPDVVIVGINFADEIFIRQKIYTLLYEWKDAQTPVQRRFLDDPTKS